MTGISWFSFFFCCSLLLPSVVPFKFMENADVDPNLQREVSGAVNPGCPEDRCSNFTLVHVQMKGNDDMIHHIWTMENKPIFFYARTDLNTNLVIDWDLMLSHERNQSVKFDNKPHYFAAVMISKFFVYNDPSDIVKLSDNSTEVIVYDPEEMSWQLSRTNFSSDSLALAAFRLESYQGSQMNSIEVVLTVNGNRERSSVLPHLMFSENSTQIDLIFKHVETDEHFANARLGVELATTALEPNSPFTSSISHSLDDEYTPGVFKLVEIRSSLNQHFLQWRPVCYTSTIHDINYSTGMMYSTLKIANISLIGDNLLNWIFVDEMLENLPIQSFDLYFGTTGDGFYKATNYTGWTMMTGHGRPIEDQFSLMVMLVMAIGLGLPFTVLLVGGTVIAFKNYKNGKDDLLLSN